MPRSSGNADIDAGRDRGLVVDPATGTVRGVQTQTVQSNECGAQGAMLRIPVLATRVGDVPSAVDVADPVTAAQTSAVPATAPTPPVLGGVCSDVDKLAYDSAANEQVVCEANSWDKAPSTAGVHPIGTSCDEPTVPVFAMSKSDDGYLIECDPASRVWEPPARMTPASCRWVRLPW